MSSSYVAMVRRDFNKLKNEAKKLIEDGKIDKEKLIASIRETRRRLAKKGKIAYREEVTMHEMIVTLANRNLVVE